MIVFSSDESVIIILSWKIRCINIFVHNSNIIIEEARLGWVFEWGETWTKNTIPVMIGVQIGNKICSIGVESNWFIAWVD